MEGRLLQIFEGSNGQLISSLAQPSYCIRIPPLTKHGIEAIEGTILFYASTPELEDVERLEDYYEQAKYRRSLRQAF